MDEKEKLLEDLQKDIVKFIFPQTVLNCRGSDGLV